MPRWFKLYHKNNGSGKKYLFREVFFGKPDGPVIPSIRNEGPSVQDISFRNGVPFQVERRACDSSAIRTFNPYRPRTLVRFLFKSLRRIGGKTQECVPERRSAAMAEQGAYRVRPPALLSVVVCLLFLSGCADVKPRPVSRKDRERIVYLLGTQRQRKKCLFGTTYNASEVSSCIECHK